MILDQVKGGEVAVAEVDAVDAMLDQDNKENLYHSWWASAWLFLFTEFVNDQMLRCCND